MVLNDVNHVEDVNRNAVKKRKLASTAPAQKFGDFQEDSAWCTFNFAIVSCAQHDDFILFVY